MGTHVGNVVVNFDCQHDNFYKQLKPKLLGTPEGDFLTGSFEVGGGPILNLGHAFWLQLYISMWKNVFVILPGCSHFHRKVQLS